MRSLLANRPPTGRYLRKFTSNACSLPSLSIKTNWPVFSDISFVVFHTHA